MKLFVTWVCLLLLLGHPCSGDKDFKDASEDMALNEVDAPEEPAAQQTRIHIDLRHPDGRKVAAPSHEHGHHLSSAGHTTDSHPSSSRVSNIHTASGIRTHTSLNRTPVTAYHPVTYGQFPGRPTTPYPNHYHQQSGTYGVPPRYRKLSHPQGLYGSYEYPRTLYPATNFRGPFRPDSLVSITVPRPFRPLSASALPSAHLSTVHPEVPISSLPVPFTPISDLPHRNIPSGGVSRPFSPQLPENSLVNQVDVRFNPNNALVNNPVNQFENPNGLFVNPANPFAVPTDLFRDPTNFVYPESPYVNLSELEGPRDAHLNFNHDLRPAGSSYVSHKVPFVNQHYPSDSPFYGSFVNRQPSSIHDGSLQYQGIPPFVNNDNAFVNLNTPIVDRDGSFTNQGSASSYINRYTPYTPFFNHGNTLREQPFVSQISPSFANPYISLSNAFNPLANQGVNAFNTRYPFAAHDDIVNHGVSSFDNQAPNAVEHDFENQDVQSQENSLVTPVAMPSLVNPSHTLANQVHPYTFLPPYAASSHFSRGVPYGGIYSNSYNQYGK